MSSQGPARDRLGGTCPPIGNPGHATPQLLRPAAVRRPEPFAVRFNVHDLRDVDFAFGTHALDACGVRKSHDCDS